MSFQGLILTDDLEMGALRDLGSVGEAAVRATKAGHDLLLICSNLARAHEAFAALREAYRSRRLDHAELEASVHRLNQFRQQCLGNS